MLAGMETIKATFLSTDLQKTFKPLTDNNLVKYTNCVYSVKGVCPSCIIEFESQKTKDPLYVQSKFCKPVVGESF